MTDLNKTTVERFTNQSGVAVAYGDVVILDTANDNSFTTTTTQALTTKLVGVVFDPGGIAIGAVGMIAVAGYVPQINLTGAGAVGDLVYTSTTVKKGVSHVSPQEAGDFAQLLTAGTTPAAHLFGKAEQSLGAAGSVVTDTVWDALGDLAVGTGANTAARLAAGTDDHVLTADSGEATGLKWAAPATSGIPENGWIAAGETWTYAAADDPTFTFTIAGVDLTTKYQAGQRIKLTQTTPKYFIITKVAFSTDTTITVYGGTDYDLANAAITSPFYSPVKAPFGFPLDPSKWAVITTYASDSVQASPVQNTWYNIGSQSISIPIGAWHVDYSVAVQINAVSGSYVAQTALSTTNNGATDAAMIAYTKGAAITDLADTLSKESIITVAAKTVHYLNTRTTSASVSNLYNVNASSNLKIRAICAYL